jgi:hypothetical protein
VIDLLPISSELEAEREKEGKRESVRTLIHTSKWLSKAFLDNYSSIKSVENVLLSYQY